MSGADILHAIRVERVWTLGQCVGRLLEVSGEDVLDGMARRLDADAELDADAKLVSGRWVDCRADVDRLPDGVLVTVAERLEAWHGDIVRAMRRGLSETPRERLADVHGLDPCELDVSDGEVDEVAEMLDDDLGPACDVSDEEVKPHG